MPKAYLYKTYMTICKRCGAMVECPNPMSAAKTKWCKECGKKINHEHLQQHRKEGRYKEQEKLEAQSWKKEQPMGEEKYYDHDIRFDYFSTPPIEAFSQLLHCLAEEEGASFKPINMSTLPLTNPDMAWLF